MKKVNFKTTVNILIAALLLLMLSCKRDNNSLNEPNEIQSMEFLNVSSNFNWKTSKTVNVEIYAKDNADNAIPKVRFNVYTDEPEKGGKLMISGVTDKNGYFQRKCEIPAYYTDLVITTDYIGLVNMVKVPVENSSVKYTFGGANKSNYKSSFNGILKSINSSFRFLGTYDSQGVPDYLEPQDDVIDNEFLDDVNASLPERQPVPQYHPQYLDDSYEHNLILTDSCTVWVTFVHEGAGWKNTLGFYTYDIDNPPTSVNDIDSITIIFPNFSYQGSGGGLHSGNKVKLGNFSANTVIGWVLIAKGWNNGQVTNGIYTLYSKKEFNPESNPDLQQHNVILNDVARKKILVGFEDIRRDESSCDNDFNDAVFYATSTPYDAIKADNFPLMTYTAADSDDDNIPDHFDDYPDDPSKAFNNYFPCEGNYASLSFEDLWPSVGDYDFNDIVIDYNINQIANGDNKIVNIEATFILKAFGAAFENGFGFELPVEKSAVSNVSGINVQDGYINLDSKNLETGQSNAVIIVFDNAYDIMVHPNTSSVGVNTTPAAPYVTPDTLNITIGLTNPLNFSTLGTPPYNPFIISDKRRGYEIHLPNKKPTDLVNQSLFNTQSDDSYPGNGRYYKTKNNLPWCINIMESFDYPIEKVQVIHAYLHFVEWAESSGELYPDWYKDKEGYRNDNNIYSH